MASSCIFRRRVISWSCSPTRIRRLPLSSRTSSLAYYRRSRETEGVTAPQCDSGLAGDVPEMRRRPVRLGQDAIVEHRQQYPGMHRVLAIEIERGCGTVGRTLAVDFVEGEARRLALAEFDGGLDWDTTDDESQIQLGGSGIEVDEKVRTTNGRGIDADAAAVRIRHGRIHVVGSRDHERRADQ